jgi:hypothetical protein
MKSTTQVQITGGNGERYDLIRETDAGVQTVGGFFPWSKVEGFWTTGRGYDGMDTRMFVPVGQ